MLFMRRDKSSLEEYKVCEISIKIYEASIFSNSLINFTIFVLIFFSQTWSIIGRCFIAQIY